MALHRRQQQQRSLPPRHTTDLLLLLWPLLILAQLARSEPCGPECIDSHLCAAPANRSVNCSGVYVSFPFFTSDDCQYEDSIFVITDCNSTAIRYPHWPGFTTKATDGSGISQTTIHDLLPPYDIDIPNSNTSTPFQSGHGYINLTWNMQLQDQKHDICDILASSDQMSSYIPSSVNLQSFAKAAFHFDSFNIILLFNCADIQARSSALLIRGGSACETYINECRESTADTFDCYQYQMPAGSDQELSLPQIMEQFDCQRAMFFVALYPSLAAPKWTAGLLRLTWNSVGTDGLGATFQECRNCFQNNGLCSLNSTDYFKCVCGSDCSVQPGNRERKRERKVERERDTGSERRNSNKVKTIIIAVSSSLVAVVIVLCPLLTMFFCKRKKEGPAAFCSDHDPKSWIRRSSFLKRKHGLILATEFPYKDLVRATDSFSEKRILGDGGFGAVYRGTLAGGLDVAVKKLHDNCRKIELFYNEINILSSINHPNLVKLYGICVCEEQRELLLVFEYASQGTVSDHLHKGLQPSLSWSLRLDIACETAAALSYLHNEVTPPVYHRDIKTTNILLDDGFHVKLADFGLSKLVPSLALSHISTTPQGTPGYLDPEYNQCYQLTDKSDVYSLGVVFMELLSGKLAVDMTRVRGQVNLSTFAVMKLQCGLLEELADPKLEMKQDPNVEASIRRVAELAFECLHTCRDDRPTMRRVSESIAHIRQQYMENTIDLGKPKLSPAPSLPISSNSSSISSLLSSS